MQQTGPRICLLGPTKLTVEGSAVERLPTRRIEALLGFLALNPGWQLRERVAEAVWPEQAEGKGLASLRNALSVLRRVFDPGGSGDSSPIESTRTHARLSRQHCTCDAWEFQEALIRHDPARAIQLYVADLMPDLHDEWITPIKQGLRIAFTQALATQSERLLDHGDSIQALKLAERWRETDPWDPACARIYALSLASSGKKLSARKFLEEFAEDAIDLEFDAVRKEIEQTVPKLRRSMPAPEPILERLESHLPTYVSRFFGRNAELQEIREFIDGASRLMTIGGIGGVGKTRLASEAGKIEALRGRDIVYVGLAGCDSELSLLTALTSAFSLHEAEGQSMGDAIQLFFAHRPTPLVLILDNLEQIVRPAVSLILDLLRSSAKVKILTTSRELLGVEGEIFLKLSPLETLDGEESNPASAVQMFVDRARLSRSDFALTPRNCADVVELCRELEGLPLAIEITAGWSGVWTVSEMRSHVRDNRLTARKRSHDARHHSLEACIDWSFNLLDAETQLFLCKLSLFRGGWTLDAAEAITDRKDTSAILAALLDRSLVHSLEFEGNIRFGMLETIRIYLRSRLPEPGSKDAATRFVAFFKEAALSLANPCAGDEERANHRRLDRESENIEAVATMCEQGLVPPDDALAMAGRLQLHWTYRGRSQVGIAILERLRKIPNPDPTGPGAIHGLQSLCVLLQESGDMENGEGLLEELVAITEASTDEVAKFRAITQMGNFMVRHGRFEEAKTSHEHALEIAKELQVPRMAAVANSNLAEALFGMDCYEAAIEKWEIAADLDLQNGNIAGEAALCLGFARCTVGDLAEGSRLLALYLRNATGLGFVRGQIRGMYYAALPAIRAGEVDLASRLVCTARANMEIERTGYNTVEYKCFALVEEALKEAQAQKGAREDFATAIELACAFLESV